MLSIASPEERVRWQVRTLTGHLDYVRSVAFSEDGNRVVSGSNDNLIKIWNSETGAEVCNRGECTRWCVEFLAFWRWLHSCFGVDLV